MTSSFAASLGFVVLHRYGIVLGTHRELLLGVAFTSLCWILTAYIGPETDHAHADLVLPRRSHPLGPGWTLIREEAGVPKAEAAEFARQDNIPLAMLGWVCGSATIWSALFMVGNILYGRTGYALGLFAVLAVTGSTLIWVIKRLWK